MGDHNGAVECGCARAVRSVQWAPEAEPRCSSHMGDNSRAWRTNRDFHASKLAVETSDLPCRSNLGGPACSERAAAAPLGVRRRLAARCARLLRDPASGRRAAPCGTGRTRPAASAWLPLRKRECLRPCARGTFPNCECVDVPSGRLSGWGGCSLFVTQFSNDPLLRCLSSDVSEWRARVGYTNSSVMLLGRIRGSIHRAGRDAGSELVGGRRRGLNGV